MSQNLFSAVIVIGTLRVNLIKNASYHVLYKICFSSLLEGSICLILLLQWRDHWMQAIYYPYTHLSVTKGDEVKVISKHDEYSLWFDVRKGGR